MRLKQVTLVFLCAVTYSATCQTNALWSNLYQNSYNGYILENNQSPRETVFTKNQFVGIPTSICGNDGKVIFNGGQHLMLNGQGMPVLDHDKTAHSPGLDFQRPSIFLRKNAFQYYLFYQFYEIKGNQIEDKREPHPEYGEGLFYTVFDTRLDNGNGGVVLDENHVPVLNGRNIKFIEYYSKNYDHKMYAVRKGARHYR